MSLLRLIFFLTVSIISGEAAKILAIFSFPYASHQVVFRPLTQELARRGHEVVVITTDPAFPKGQTPINLTEIDVHDVSYKIWTEALQTPPKENDDSITQTIVLQDIMVTIVEHQILSNEVQSLINSNVTFDLILTQDLTRPTLIYSCFYKVPVIHVSSLGAVFNDYETIGASTQPILYPGFTHKKIYNLTIWDKIVNVYNKIRLDKIYENHKDLENEMFKRVVGPEAPTVDELKRNVHLLTLNVHQIWEGNFPVPPSVVYIGGLKLKPDKKLPENLQSFLDSSKHGVIYVSFGSHIKPSLLPQYKLRMIVRVLSQLPNDVLLKWDKDELPGKTKNIKLGKWFPQSDLLKHPKIKLFITQGGLQSIDDAINAKVPLICIPMRVDQWYNAEKVVFHRIGVRLDLELIAEEKLLDAINTVIIHPSYKENIARLHSLMYHQPQTPLERFVWWAEHVLCHSGSTHLRASAAKISLAEYFEFELIFLLFIYIFLLFCVLIYLVLNVKTALFESE